MHFENKPAADLQDLAPQFKRIVEEEQALLDKVHDSIERQNAKWSSSEGKSYKELRKLRDDTVNARPADLPTLLNELRTAQAVHARQRTDSPPDPASPYFAHMRTREGETARDFLLGKGTFIESSNQVRIIDWRHAPISRIFYRYKEGDEFVEDLPQRTAEGVLEIRRVVSIIDGKLSRIMTPEFTIICSDDNHWIVLKRDQTQILSGGEGTAQRGQSLGTGQSGSPLPDVTALLDEKQYQALTESGHDPMLILGGAGSGKTTVAMHRLATLVYNDPERFDPSRLAVVVPERGLAKLTEQLLAALEMEETQVLIYQTWLREQAERMLQKLPKSIYPDTPLLVSRLKRHPALWSVLPEVVARQTKALTQRIQSLFPDDLPGVGELGAKDGCALDIIDEAKDLLADNEKKKSGLPAQEILKKLEKEKTALYQPIETLWELLTDQELLSKAVELSDQDLEASAVSQCIRHTMQQMAESAEKRYSGIDESRLQAIDGEAIDYGTPEEAAQTRDPEDDALLLELLRLTTGRIGTRKKGLPTFEHLILDEAQELAPIELSILGRTLTSDPSITVAGDAVQQVSEGSAFSSWEKLLDHMGVSEVAEVVLEVNYRSSKNIAEFAHRLLGPLAPDEPPKTRTDGVEVGRFAFATEEPFSIFLTEAVTDLVNREPKASMAIICRHLESAQGLYEILQDVSKVRLVTDGDFSFTPGVDITDVNQVKGLEFDYVIIPDADADKYPLMPISRRKLHVAATRAIHQLWVVSVGHPSPVLPI